MSFPLFFFCVSYSVDKFLCIVLVYTCALRPYIAVVGGVVIVLLLLCCNASMRKVLLRTCKS